MMDRSTELDRPLIRSGSRGRSLLAAAAMVHGPLLCFLLEQEQADQRSEAPREQQVTEGQGEAAQASG